MAKQIKHSDIAEKGLMNPTIENLKELDRILGTVIVSVKSLSKDLKKTFKGADFKTPEGVKKFKAGLSQLGEAEKQYQNTLKQRKVILAKMVTQQTEAGKANIKLKIHAQEQEKAVKALAREEMGLTSAYDKLGIRLNKLRKEYKHLVVEQGKETRATKRLRKEITKLANVQAKVDASVGQFQRNVGNYTKALGGLSRVIGATGLTLGFMGLFRVIGNGLKSIRDFDQANADLAAVLGQSRGEISALTEDAQRLGGVTKYTATQIVGLQKELGKLGFSSDAIINMTEATQQLATAAGVELAEAAEVTGNTLRAFGLAASDTQEVVDIMARSFATSGLDMNRFKESMKLVAPSARATGRTLKDTSKLLAILANNGISGSLAGTQLNRVFVELNKEGISLEDAIKKVSAAKNGLSEATDLVGDRGAKALLIFAKSTEELKKQKEELDNVSDAAKDAAETQLDTLGGAVTLLASKWDNLIHKVNKSTGALGGLKSAIQFVTKNLESIIKWIVRGATVWGAYRLALMLVNKETGKLKSFGIIKFLKKMATGVVSLTKGTKRAAVGIRGMGRAIKAIPFVGWIAGLAAVIPMLVDVVRSSSKAAVQQERWNRALGTGKELAKEENEAILSSYEKRIIKEKEILAARLETAKTADDREEAVRRTSISIKNAIKDELKGIAELQKHQRELINLEKTRMGNILTDKGKALTAQAGIIRETELDLKEKLANADEIAGKLFVDLRIESAKKALKAGKELSVKDKEQNKERLSELQRLKKELGEVQKAREKALTTPEAAKSAEFKEQTRRRNQLNDRISQLERILKLELKRAEVLKATPIETAATDADERGLVISAQHKEMTNEIELEETRKDQQQQRISDILSLTDVIAEEAQRRLKIEEGLVNSEINIAKRRVAELSRISKKGSLEAGQSIALEEKRLAELERKKLVAKRKAQRIEAAVAGFKLLGDAIDKDSARPVAETVSGILKVTAALQAIPQFYEGTDNVGKSLGEPHLNTARDRYVVRVDGKERIVDPANNAKIGSLTNDELGELAELNNTGIQSDSYKAGQMPVRLVEHAYMSNAQILKKFDKLSETMQDGNDRIAREIKKKPVPYLEYDQLKNAVMQGVIQDGKNDGVHIDLDY